MLVGVMGVLFVVATAAGCFYWQNQQNKEEAGISLARHEVVPNEIPNQTKPVNEISSPTKTLSPEVCSFAEFHFQLNCLPGVKTSIGKVAYENTASISYYGKNQSPNNPGFVDGFVISVIYKPLGLSDLKAVADKDRLAQYGGDKFNLTSVNIGNTSGYQYYSTDNNPANLSSNRAIFLENGDKSYNKLYIEIEGSDKQTYQKTVDQILASFKTLP